MFKSLQRVLSRLLPGNKTSASSSYVPLRDRELEELEKKYSENKTTETPVSEKKVKPVVPQKDDIDKGVTKSGEDVVKEGAKATGTSSIKQEQTTKPDKNIDPSAVKKATDYNMPGVEPHRSEKPGTSYQNNSSNNRRSRRNDQQVYIGLDFGTTFTKAAYSIAPSPVQTKYSVRFSNTGPNAYYLPSVLYFDKNTHRLMINPEPPDLEAIRYFKYSMISDALHKDPVLNAADVTTENPKEQLCSAFYISYVISLIRAAVQNNPNARNLDYGSKWYINMGVPLEASKDAEHLEVFRDALNVGWLYSQDYPGVEEVNIHEFDKYFSDHSGLIVDNANLLPELYAEILLYQQNANISNGFYTIIDIGGGTADIAIFLKSKEPNEDVKILCLEQKVEGLGFEALAELLANSFDTEKVKYVQKYLQDKSQDFNSDDIQHTLPDWISLSHYKDCRKEFRTMVGTCFQGGKTKKRDLMKKTKEAKQSIKCFIMGGANNVAFYRQSIKYMMDAQKSSGVPDFVIGNVMQYLTKDIRLEVNNNPRLLISQMLAQPYELIPTIDMMPWDLPAQQQDFVDKSDPDMLREILEQKYPK